MDNQHGQPTWTVRTPVLFASSARRDPFRPKTTTMHFDSDIRVLWEQNKQRKQQWHRKISKDMSILDGTQHTQQPQRVHEYSGRTCLPNTCHCTTAKLRALLIVKSMSPWWWQSRMDAMTVLGKGGVGCLCKLWCEDVVVSSTWQNCICTTSSPMVPSLPNGKCIKAGWLGNRMKGAMSTVADLCKSEVGREKSGEGGREKAGEGGWVH